VLAASTLVELVVVLILTAIVSAVAARFVAPMVQSYFTGRDVTEVDWQARTAVERMTRELRTIRAPADLTITSASDITFTDIDGNSIRYCQGGVAGCPGAAGDLMRNGQSLATGVGALTFSFLTRTATATGSAAAAYYVNATFTAAQNNVTKSFLLTVSPRNFP
jgi:hypothetical protein